MSVKIKYWVAGITLAIAGLILARVISPAYSGQSVLQLSVFLAGVAVAMAGLGLILVGLRK